LPVEARQVVADTALVRLSSRGDVVVLRREGIGAATVVDRRGRMRLPVWLRRQIVTAGAAFVAARRPDASTVVVTPVAGLDDVADALVGEVG
jgi:hypothetical protein